MIYFVEHFGQIYRTRVICVISLDYDVACVSPY